MDNPLYTTPQQEIKSKFNPNYSFLVGGPCPFKKSTNQFLFHTEIFWADQDVIFFYVLNKKRSLCEGVFVLATQENVGYSPLKAPFGSIDMDTLSPLEVLGEFLDLILQWAKNKLVSTIKIKHYPQCYDPEGTALIQNLLFSRGFEVTDIDIAQFIEVGVPPSSLFSQSEKNRLNKCIRAGFSFELLENYSSSQVYQLIKACKDRKGYPTSMSFDSFNRMLVDFCKTYLVFGVKDRDKLVSVSICIVINGDIIYDFMHGHLLEYDQFSPVVFLVNGVYDYCLSNGFKILDLGLSTEQSLVNAGLYNFKARLGTRPSLKISFAKK